MDILIKECGNLLKWLEEQRTSAQSQPVDEKRIYRNMIAEYEKVLLKLEQRLSRQDVKTYLEVRRAKHAVKTGMEQTIPTDVLYAWMVQNLCDLEGLE